MKRSLSLATIPALCGLFLSSGCAPTVNRAARRGDLMSVQRMLDRGTNVDTSDVMNFSQTPLHEAAAGGHTELVKLLIARGANVNKTSGNLTHDHGTPLVWLHRHPCDEESLKIAKMLVEAGADVNAESSWGTPLEIWAGQKNQDSCSRAIVAILRDAERIKAELKERTARAAAEKARGEQVLAELAVRGSDIEAAEKEGDAAAAAGDAPKAVGGYLAALKKCPAGSEPEARVREKLLRSAASAPPPVPEEAVRMSQRAQAFLKFAQDRAGFAKAAGELEGALRLAPWWGEAYFNMGLVQEKLGAPAEAIRYLKLYLLASPGAADAEKVKAKLIELEVKQELEKSSAP